MTTETASRITVPRIEVYGAGDLNRLRPFEFEGEIATDIGDYQKPFHELHKGSITLRDQAALFQAYLLSELGEAPDLPEEVRGVLDYLFNQVGRGNATNDACDYNNGKRGMRKSKDTDRSVRWVIQPEGFERTEDGWKAILGENSEEHFILVPKEGYVELTVDGAYRPDTGTPFSTAESREEAEQSWIKREFGPEFAEKAVSYFHSREENQGTAAVSRWYYDAGDGRFRVGAYFGPGNGDSGVGSFSVSRSPSGARPASEKGVVVVGEAEYKALTKAAEGLSDGLKALKG